MRLDYSVATKTTLTLAVSYQPSTCSVVSVQQ